MPKVSSNGDDDRDDHGSSAPWERAGRFTDEPLPSDDPAQGDPRPARRRRYAEDGEGVAASALIAALSGAAGQDEPEPEGEPDEASEPGEALVPGEAAGDETPRGEAAFDDATFGEATSGPASYPPVVSHPSPGAIDTGAFPTGAVDDEAVGSDQADDGDDLVSATGHGPSGASWQVAGRVLVAMLAVVALLVAGTGWVIKLRADNALADRQISALNPSDTNISSPTVDPTATGDIDAAAHITGPVVPENLEAENILILGSDDRPKAADAALGGANRDPGGSDVVMVAHLTADRSHITVVSIPRDTYIQAPTCKAWDYSKDELSDEDFTSPYSLWRINSTYAAGGAPCTVKAVQEMTGLRIDRVIVIDFAGFATMVDALDGIDVNACRPIIDGQLGTVLPVAGVQHIDGKQALDLVRARKVEGDSTSDIARIKRQQKVLSTILKQMTTAGVLLNPVKLDSVLQAFVQNVSTDNVTIDSLVDIAQSLGDLNPRRVTFFTLPTVPDSNGVGLHATDGAPLIWEALREDKPLPGEVTDPVTPTTPSTAPTTPMTTIPQDPITSLVTSVVTTTPDAPQMLSVDPRDVDLQIVNVANRGLVATNAQQALESVGFRFGSADLLRLDGQNQSGYTVEYSAENRAAALTVAAAVPGATLVEKSGLGNRVRLLIGTSFDAESFMSAVRSVAAGDPVPSALSTTPEPVTTTVTSTVVTTPPPLTVPVTPTTDPAATSASSAPTLGSADLTSVNAGSAGCI